MGNEIKVEKGEKVGSYNPGTKEVRDIHTVIKQTDKGTIIVTDGYGKLQYDINGWAKGRAYGKIRKLEEGEEEQFIEAKKAKWAEEYTKRQEKEAQRAQKLEMCRRWVQANAWDVNSIKTVSCTLYIVSLPIPDAPYTLVMRFDEHSKRFGDAYKYSVSISTHHSEKGYSSNLGKLGYISGGITSANSALIAPLEIAAEWMAAWIHIDELEVPENVAG